MRSKLHAIGFRCRSYVQMADTRKLQQWVRARLSRVGCAVTVVRLDCAALRRVLRSRMRGERARRRRVVRTDRWQRVRAGATAVGARRGERMGHAGRGQPRVPVRVRLAHSEADAAPDRPQACALPPALAPPRPSRTRNALSSERARCAALVRERWAHWARCACHIDGGVRRCPMSAPPRSSRTTSGPCSTRLSDAPMRGEARQQHYRHAVGSHPMWVAACPCGIQPGRADARRFDHSWHLPCAVRQCTAPCARGQRAPLAARPCGPAPGLAAPGLGGRAARCTPALLIRPHYSR
jgi:hypothetical protein